MCIWSRGECVRRTKLLFLIQTPLLGLRPSVHQATTFYQSLHLPAVCMCACIYQDWSRKSWRHVYSLMREHHMSTVYKVNSAQTWTTCCSVQSPSKWPSWLCLSISYIFNYEVTNRHRLTAEEWDHDKACHALNCTDLSVDLISECWMSSCSTGK